MVGRRTEKKEFRFFNQDISNEYHRAITDPNIQAEAMEISNFLENQETRELNRIKEDTINNQPQQSQQPESYSYEQEEDMDLEYADLLSASF